MGPAANLTVRQFSYPWHIELLSRALAPLARLGAVGGQSPEQVARAAFARLGEPLPAPAERERLLGPEFQRLLPLLTAAEMAPLGQVHWRAALVAAAYGRIRLERYLAAGRPMGEVTEPVFVVGLPRTGTSLMQRLVAEDPERRGLRTFELQSPIPDEPAALLWPLKRRAFAALISLVYRLCTPELLKLHYTSATSLEECWMLFMSSYAVLSADYVMAPDTRFGDALLEDGLLSAYERYHQLLSILALEQPGTKFVLKSPEHLWFLPSLLKVFPTARVIWTHRDPAKAVPSYAAQVSLLARQHKGQADPVMLGQHVLHRFVQGVRIGQDTCDQVADARIAHVHYAELVRDPVGTVAAAYRKLDLTLTPRHEDAMRKFLARPQRDKAKNRYRAEVFGLDERQVRAEFSGYMSRFGVEPELPGKSVSVRVAPLLEERVREV